MSRPTINSLSVIIPVYNEQDNVTLLAREIDAALSPAFGDKALEIIFVDDASTDDTKQLLNELQKNLPSLKVLAHASNAGQSAAVISGVKASRHNWVATLDGDGQNDPLDILKLIKATQATDNLQPILCMGYREKRQDSALRKLSSTIANKIRSWMLNDQCPDSGCGIKLFDRHTFLQLPHFRNCHRFLPALFKRSGAKVINVPVNHRERLHGQSKYGIHNRLWVGVIDLLGVAWLLRRNILVENQYEPSTHTHD